MKNGKGIKEVKVFIGHIQFNKKQILDYLLFRCDITHWNYSLIVLGRTFKLQKENLKTEMNHDEVNVDNWKEKNYE